MLYIYLNNDFMKINDVAQTSNPKIKWIFGFFINFCLIFEYNNEIIIKKI